MRRQTRDRLVLPVLLPAGILVALAAALFGFSRILLSLPATAATAIALVVAASIVVVSGLAASRTTVRASSLGSIVAAIAGVAMLAGGVALVAASPEAPAGGAGPGGASGGGPVVNVVAQGSKFDTAEIDLPANTAATIHFENRDAGVQHNIAIFTDETMSKVLLRGDLVTGPGSVDYRVPGLPPGTYYFHCDVHPMMNGKVVVKPPAAGTATSTASPGAAGSGAGVSVTAEGMRFDASQVQLPANTASTITFTNKDAGVTHNIAIYSDSSRTTNLFGGQIVSGPATVTYSIPPLPPGTYYFQCDVHPTMNGTVTVG